MGKQPRWNVSSLATWAGAQGSQTETAALTEGGHVLARLDRQETDEWNLHAGQGSQSIPGSVADVETSAVSAHADQDKGMQWEETGDEGISAPRRHHVSVEQRAESAPQHGTQLQHSKSTHANDEGGR